jgi:hypothetical protein
MMFICGLFFTAEHVLTRMATSSQALSRITLYSRFFLYTVSINLVYATLHILTVYRVR